MKAKLLVLAIGLLPVLAYGAGNDNWMYNLENYKPTNFSVDDWQREKERQAAEAQTPVRNCRDRSQSRLQRHKPPSGIAETDPNRL